MYVVPGCAECEAANANGGPGHFNQSSKCQYQPYPKYHCSCDKCF